MAMDYAEARRDVRCGSKGDIGQVRFRRPVRGGKQTYNAGISKLGSPTSAFEQTAVANPAWRVPGLASAGVCRDIDG